MKENRFRFKSRTKQINQADVSVFNNLSQENPVPLSEYLGREYDQSSAFQTIRKSIQPLANSLPLLIYNLPKVIKVIEENIDGCPNSGLQVIKALAREIRFELAQFFDNLLAIFIKLCERIDLLEEIFNCLSICMKYSVKELNPRDVLFKAIPMINHKNEGIRHLAAQSFAFLVKKAGPVVLGDLLKDCGPNIWEIIKYSATEFHCKEILEISWECYEAAKFAHLALALEQKHIDSLYDSITKASSFEVLRDWAILCNGNRFPKSFHEKSIQFCKDSKKFDTLAYIIKYHTFLIDEISFILQQDTEQAIVAFGILVDFNDPHPEREIHESILKKKYANHNPQLDLLKFSNEIYQLIDKALLTDKAVFALEILLKVFKNHHISSGNLHNLKNWISLQNDEDLIWLGLRVARLTETDFDTQAFSNTKNQFLLREIFSINKSISDDEIYGEILWAASELNKEVKDVKPIYKYLTHPTLRIPAAQLLCHTSQAMNLAWLITQDSPTIETEKGKVTNLKRIEHLISEDPEGVCLFLLGMFWDRYSPLWTHITHSLSVLGKSYPDLLWGNLYPLLLTLPERSEYPPYYEKYNSFRDSTPNTHYFINLCEVLAACPKALHSNLNEFIDVFLKFINEDYAKISWIPGYMAPKAPEQGSEAKRKLPCFLKALKEQRNAINLSHAEDIEKILIGLCTKKKENIRVLAVECLISLFPALRTDSELLRNLAKDATFRDAALIKPIAASNICIALCAGRGFSTSQYNKSAFIYISGLPTFGYLLELLPFKLKTSHFNVLEILPHKLILNVFKSYKKIINYVSECIDDKEDAVLFLIQTCNWARTEDKREVLTKSLGCLNLIISKYVCSENCLERTIELISPALDTFAHDLRPKYIETLHILLNNYPQTRTNQVLITACTNLLTNPKAEAQHIHKTLEVLASLITPEIEIDPHSLISALERVGLTGNLSLIFHKITPSSKVSPLIEKLIPFCFKKPELVNLLSQWIPYAEALPTKLLTELVLKRPELTSLLGQCISGVAGEILKDLSATKRKGLEEEAEYETQLNGIFKISECEIEEEFLPAVINTLGQFLIVGDLGLRSACIKAFIHLGKTKIKQVESCLSIYLKKAKDEEHVRGILQVWNSIDSDIKSLSHTKDEERSLLLSLGHLQIHRRARALSAILTMEFPKQYITKLFIPLINFYLLYSSSKSNYQSNFIYQLIQSLAAFAKQISWREYHKLLKVYLKKLEEEEKLATKAIAGILANIPDDLDESAYNTLKSKVLPVLKMHMCDQKDSWRPKVRKYVVCAMYSIISTQSKDEGNSEFYRLLSMLARHYKNKDDGTKESVISSVLELLKTKSTHNKIVKEFNQFLEAELFAHFLTKILPSGLLEISDKYLDKAVKTLLEYEQYQTFYYLGKFIKPEHLGQILASTKPLQYIAQGLAENEKITPEDLISLALILLNRNIQAKQEENPKISRKLQTFAVQDGAAKGSRPVNEVKKVNVGADKVFGMRLLKLGIKRSKEGIDEELAKQCKETAINNLSVKKDEVVAGALEILKMFADSSVIEKILEISERAGEQVTIQAMKTISSLIKSRADIESLAPLLLPQVLLALHSYEVQSSALKLLRVFVLKRIMDPSVYDCFEEVPQILLSNPKLSTQATSLYVDFLLNYPLSDKRKQYHLDFLIKNLGTTIHNANKSIMTAIDTILEKLPYEELKEHFDFLLLAIFTAISNEDSDDMKKSYFTLLSKTAKKNQNSPIIKQIASWVTHKNESVRKTAINFVIMCVNEKIISDDFIKNDILSKVLESEDNWVENLEFLNCWLGKYKSKKYLARYREMIVKHLELGVDLKPELFEPLNECDTELLKIGTSGIINGTFKQGIFALFSKANPLLASKKLSTIVRKLIGRNIEDSRVESLLRCLLFYISSKQYDQTSLFKALIIASERSPSTTIKDLANEIFQTLHKELSQEEFVDAYTNTRNLLNTLREERKSKSKLMAVTNPEVAAKLKEKRKIKTKLLKKHKIFKFAPHKKLKTDLSE
ncbi:unnamed protein product [Blepharisma stoltei]|uniref:Uncharacterized protein n=1 Tax=Blepharisma stoltei TaxID=1481888 RepID=A0AAU9JW94_9CILI|nr:unnamed protein product [Blepharisma stoltei]